MFSFAAVFATNVLSTQPAKKPRRAIANGANTTDKTASAKEDQLADNRAPRPDEATPPPHKDH